VSNYYAWVNSQESKKARVYETRLFGASNQFDMTVEVTRGETPLGRPEHTYVSFKYHDPTNGIYEFSWQRLGRHKADFLNLTEKPKRVWVVLPRSVSTDPPPRLEIVAFEGVEFGGGVIAEPG
jgi:hypothetical protein